MPKVKVQPGKVTVCCGDRDCVEIDTSNDPSSGNGGSAPPWEPPLSGGVAVYAPRMMIETLDMRKIAPQDLSKHVEPIEKRLKGFPTEDLEVTLKLIVPPGSKLRATALQALATRLNAKIEVHFASQE